MTTPTAQSTPTQPARRVGRSTPPQTSNVMRWLTLCTTVGPLVWTIWLFVMMRNLPHWTGFDTKHPLMILLMLTGIVGIAIVLAYIALVVLRMKGRPYPTGGLIGIGVLMIWQCFLLYHNLGYWLY